VRAILASQKGTPAAELPVRRRIRWAFVHMLGVSTPVEPASQLRSFLLSTQQRANNTQHQSKYIATGRAI